MAIAQQNRTRLRTALVFSDRKRVLNAGSGLPSKGGLHSMIFKSETWSEVRIDIDPATEPDVIGSITEMQSAFTTGSFDAVWSSHSLEHLDGHQVLPAMSEFHRILKPDGFALVRTPDLEAVTSALLKSGANHVAYMSAIGPITPLDMLYGHSGSIKAGSVHMAHKTGFTAARIGHLLLEAGFSTVFTKSEQFDLWALALKDKADNAAIQRQLHAVGLRIFADAA